MPKTNLIDPRHLYHPNEFPEQTQDTPALQQAMQPKPDCGETSYVGHERLKDRNVLITGGDSGIGRAVAIAFAREGANIAFHYLPDEAPDAEEVKDLIEAEGRKAVLLPADFRDADAPQDIVAAAIDALGSLDTLVLNAGQQIQHQEIADLPMQQVHDTFMVNVEAMFAIVQAALPHLEPGSTITTTTSIQAFSPSPHLLDYAASKAAIANYTLALAQKLTPEGIRVNGVAPGPIWTPLQLDHGQPEDKIPTFGQDALIGRAGMPVELAPVYVLLASNEASYISGQIYGVTGGAPINP
ncbi:SDR family oxidoreductase [Lacticaseibacillus saniviri]|uniref:SDR family oxidoreductase n=1 Tax=Lacticaseibacillus saniviri TaxID=931533 RepID=UPI001EE1053E|nr:SDR family oxidoreductase [Lacticaseibacillus saniviri]MCG4282969.1 SDR family oxidoreductase [Lacticaseibacillus saniviri]